MNVREVERLVEKYYNGNTNLEEEKDLKEYFLSDKVAPHLKSLRAHFIYLNESKKDGLSANFFSKRFEEAIDDEKFISLKKIKRLKWYFASGIAASVIAVVGLFLPTNSSQQMSEKEYLNNMKIIQKWLYFTSSKVDKGLSKVEDLKGLDEDKLDKYDRIQKKFTKYINLDKDK
ncbi:MAG: hypothetical protein ACEPOV_04215 [Hyphomicrobiales bacterium]